MNFLTMDDITVNQEGKIIDPHSVISLPVKDGKPVFPEFARKVDDLLLIWSETRRKITGADLLGCLLHGIAYRDLAKQVS